MPNIFDPETSPMPNKPLKPNSAHYVHPNKIVVDEDGNIYLQISGHIDGGNRLFRVKLEEVEASTSSQPAKTVRARPGTPVE